MRHFGELPTAEPASTDPNAVTAGATRAAPFVITVTIKPQDNLASISRQYPSRGLRPGVHFNIVGSFVGEEHNENRICPHFAGDVTELRRRAPRADLLRRILEHYELVVGSGSELATARVVKISQDALLSQATMIGKPVGSARQHDIVVNSEGRGVQRLVNGHFEIIGAGAATARLEGRDG